MDCSNSDWKLFRCRLAEWQEAYMDKLNKGYAELLSEDIAASEKFWKLEKKIKQDKNHPGVILSMKRQEMVYDIVELINDNVITVDALDGFSDDLKEKVSFLMHR